MTYLQMRSEDSLKNMVQFQLGTRMAYNILNHCGGMTPRVSIGIGEELCDKK